MNNDEAKRHPSLVLRERLGREGREQLLQDGPLPAPWEKYPDRTPYGGWNQGEQAFFLDYVFLPWWRSLNGEDRNRYLRAKNAPPDWSDFLGRA
jgi:hypothetical protein